MQTDNTIIREDNEGFEKQNDEEMETSEEGIERRNNEVGETLFEPEDTTVNCGNEENGETITNYRQPGSTESVKQVRDIQKQPSSKTDEDLFMENVKNLGPRRQRRIPKRFSDDVCSAINSLTSEIDEL